MKVTAKLLNDLVSKYGIENVLVLIPSRPVRTVAGLIAFTSSSDDPVPTLCRIDESRYAPNKSNKFTFVPLEPGFEKHHIYQDDLSSVCGMQVFVIHATN